VHSNAFHRIGGQLVLRRLGLRNRSEISRIGFSEKGHILYSGSSNNYGNDEHSYVPDTKVVTHGPYNL
jgi:hypothetical protein